VAAAEGYALQIRLREWDDLARWGTPLCQRDPGGTAASWRNSPPDVIYDPTPDGACDGSAPDFRVIADTESNLRVRRNSLGSFFIVVPAQIASAAAVLHPAFLGVEDHRRARFVNWHPPVSCDSLAALNRNKAKD